MTESILKSTKKNLNLPDDYDVFDPDVIMHINSVFSTLHQLGLGPAQGFEIEDDQAVWNDFTLGSLPLNAVKTYIFLRVRLLFDPPATSFHIQALKEQILELEWRLNVQREGAIWDHQATGLPYPSPSRYS